ncbi:APC family permease [Streptomyces acidiscabies]|uniref:Amino acid permease n=1 Tax=Streptomyces acidiscabies TaxID=42234 RepID=A0AAP6BFG8_9ACTN|nr:amino acid permease [Streptomyces acidiscabies]MBP5941168.1 amino acid permease [Streptomyces sp. LBUM 1476]MBZ3912495.1 amino acid permease [Streptomyces acidiscabies]MDX2963713.1 amino acid permease [Streptomyces acidiscabies]MDX3021544.1 amino acid permease [Streptomyces acidiscabies]MDX3793811.1 amino acid permease [Streptomyces acidiscabies]
MTGAQATQELPVRPVGRLTLWQGAALYIGAVLGTGVIALPSLAARAAGPASLLAWLGLVLLSIPLATTFAALGARYPDGGGVSTYVRHAFGARAAAVVGWCFYFAVPAGAPAAGMFAGAYVATAVGGGRRTVVITAAVLLILVAVANGFGLTVTGRMQLTLAVLLVALLLVAVATALPHAHVRNLYPFAPHGWPAIGSAAALLVWSFAGWEAITHLAADFRRPARDLPRATALAVAVVGVLYLAVATTSVLVLGPAAGTSEAPLSELLALGIGGTVHTLSAAAALLLTLGTMNAYFAGAAKLGAALGRDGALPAWLSQGSSVGEVPRRSLAVVSGLSGLALTITTVASVGPQPLVLLTTGSFVTVYALGTAAALRLLPRGSLPHRSALLTLIAVVALLVMTGWYLLWPLIVTASALCYLRWRRATGSAAS